MEEGANISITFLKYDKYLTNNNLAKHCNHRNMAALSNYVYFLSFFISARQNDISEANHNDKQDRRWNAEKPSATLDP